MSATPDAVASKKDKPGPTPEEQAAEELARQAREQGLSLTGPDGLLKQLTKAVLETALDQEMTEHLVMRRTARWSTRTATSATGHGRRRC